MEDYSFLIFIGLVLTLLLAWRIKYHIWDIPMKNKERAERAEADLNICRNNLDSYRNRNCELTNQLVDLKNAYSKLEEEERKILEEAIQEKLRILHSMEDTKNIYNAGYDIKIGDLQNELHRLENEVKTVLTKKESEENIEVSCLKKYIEKLENEICLLNKKYRPDEVERLKNELNLIEVSKSNLTAIPYMAAIIADYETYGIEDLAVSLNWGYDKKRLEKVQSIREIRRGAQELVEKYKESDYQLKYLLELYPGLKEIIETDYSQVHDVQLNNLMDYDHTRDYISPEEYAVLSEAERNQLALDRYKNSHSKTKWQVGRDYEQYVGWKYEKNGNKVEYFGTFMGLEDLGRDLIVHRDDGHILIIQCKYWSQIKEIHEKHITQLYGTVASYCIENDVPADMVKGILITNISLSEMAKKMANYLKIDFKENYEIGEYPRIKCNIGKNENGADTYIYHLPFDQQYDSVKIDKPGEMYAMTVEEAMKNGFRRAYRWHGID